MRRFEAGESVVLREVWQGRTWSVRPAISVEDGDEVIAVYTPAHSPALFPRGEDGERLRIPAGEWRLGRAEATDHNVLGLHVPGDEHSVLLVWDEAWSLEFWYINIEKGLERRDYGYDYKDEVLDIVVSPRMESWRWKDEDELEEAVARGVFTAEDAARLRREGERAVRRLLAREPPFDREWEGWRPDPGWGVPPLPDEWLQTADE